MISIGMGDWRSCGCCDAIPKPVSQTLPTSSTSMFAGLMSLWMRPCWWTWPIAFVNPMAMRLLNLPPNDAADAKANPRTFLGMRSTIYRAEIEIIRKMCNWDQTWHPPGADKGTALTGLVRERAARSVLFCGDDLGDLPAFAAVRALRADGVPGCTVASASPESPQVAAAADLVVDGPEGIVALLAAIAAELGG